MTEKLIGGLAVILSSAIWGNLRGADERKKLSSLEEFISLVNFVNGNIEHFKTPLCEIYRQFAESSSDKRRLSPEMSRFIRIAEKDGISAAWNQNILNLPDEAEPTAMKFVTEVGRGYADEEAELCRYTVESLTTTLEKLKEEVAGRVKMWRTLPPLFASSVVLIFL